MEKMVPLSLLLHGQLSAQSWMIKLREKIDITVSKRKENKTFQYLMGFVHLVKRLFTFIEAVHSRNWDLYLSSFEAIIKDFTSFDRIKYRRWSAVYLTDMLSLKDNDDLEDRKVWQAFSNGDFSCQKFDIPGTAIGRYHCGEQENRKIKNRGGILGIIMNPNSRTRHFLAAPVLASITDQMFDLGGHITRRSTKHHQLNIE